MIRIGAAMIGILPLVLLGCAAEEGGGPPPPIDADATSMTGFSSMTGLSSMSGGSGDAETSGTGTDTDTDMGTASGGSTGGLFTVISGSLYDGGGGYSLPITCSVRFHLPGEIEPSSGVQTGFTFARPFVVDQFPQSFTIDSEQAGGAVAQGDVGFVSTACDVDGDSLFDDGAGGYYPSLPMAPITLPASEIFVDVGEL